METAVKVLDDLEEILANPKMGYYPLTHFGVFVGPDYITIHFPSGRILTMRQHRAPRLEDHILPPIVE